MALRAGDRACNGCGGPRPESAREAAGARSGAAGTGDSHGRRTDHDRRDRPRQPRTVHRRPEERRVRDLRGRRQAGIGVVHADPRRSRVQRRAAATAAAAGRHHPATGAPDQRRRRADLPHLCRRPPPGLPQHRADSRALQENLEGADPRRRHVRDRVDRALVAVDRLDLRSEAARSGDQQDYRVGTRTEGHPRRAGGRAGTARSPVSCPRRVLDRQRHHRQPRAGSQPPESLHLRQQRIRLQSVPGDAEEAGAGKVQQHAAV